MPRVQLTGMSLSERLPVSLLDDAFDHRLVDSTDITHYSKEVG